MLYKIITTIEVDETSGSINIIKTEKMKIDDKNVTENFEIIENKPTIIGDKNVTENFKNIEDKPIIIECIHKLKRSEPQYGMFSFTLQETPELYRALPLNSYITVIFENKQYDVHTHSSIYGRITRLSHFYRNFYSNGRKLEEEDSIQVTYNTATQILEISKIIFHNKDNS